MTEPDNQSPFAALTRDPVTLKDGAEFTTMVVLVGRVSSDPDGDALTYAWDAPGGTFVDGTGPADDSVHVSFSGGAAVLVTLTVTDPDGAESSAAVTLELGTGLTKFQRNYVEALFLGSGPFAPSDGLIACMGETGRWTAFPEGTSVQVVVGSTVGLSKNGEDIRQFYHDAIVDISYATAGFLDATLVESDVWDPLPEDGQVVSADHPNPQGEGCAFERGCTLSGYRNPPDQIILSWARAVQKSSLNPADGFVHDAIGHGLMGLCHIDQASIGGNHMSLMPGGPGAFSGQAADKLTPTDMVATRAVYSAGLEHGARRPDFKAKDLVN